MPSNFHCASVSYTARIFILVSVALTIAASASANPINTGDVFVSFTRQGVGQVRHYDSNMNLLETVNTGYGAFPNGMAFDGNGDLFVTNLNDPFISRFSRANFAPLPAWSTGIYGAEDMLFDGNCNAWVGSTVGGIYKIDPSGTALGTYLPGQRTDWIDLASDQKTMLYTHEGQGSDAVLRADVGGSPPGTPQSDFVPALPVGPNQIGYAVKFLPDGGILVTDREDIRRYTSAGTPAATPIYDAPGHDNWFGMALGVGGTSLWAVDLAQQDIVSIDLVTGVPTITPMNDNTVFMGSVIVAGGYSAAACNAVPEPGNFVLALIGVSALGMNGCTHRRCAVMAGERAGPRCSMSGENLCQD
jgi:hypothetical protein